MVEQIRADEKLARFVAGLSPHMQGELLNALQGYHEQFYNEFVHAGTDHLARTQGKVQAMALITTTVQNARNIVEEIERRRMKNKVTM
jgi:hypothetical protein